MKKIFALLFLISCALQPVGWLSAAPEKKKPHEMPEHPTRLIAKVAPGAHGPSVARALGRSEMKIKKNIPLVPGLLVLDSDPAAGPAVKGGPGRSLHARGRMLRESGLFEYVEPDYIVTASLQPNDTALTDGTLWGLPSVDAPRAWDITTGSANVIVAVIDTGIRYTHQELAAQMWHNPGEIPGNGIDDDGDGIVDNVYGMNAINGSGDPYDDHFHGTHVAGTIGAAANDGHPHVGVAWQVRLMACKFLDAGGSGNTSDAIECINFAVAHGARVLNNSWGGGGYSQALHDAILAARNAGVLFVAAAGNNGEDGDASPHYPSSYDVDNIVSVAAMDSSDHLAGFSNYGRTSVDLGAPGVHIYSCGNASDSDYRYLDGTSMATPHVCGVAALLLARYPSISVSELKMRLLNTTVPLPALSGRCVSGGRVNAYNALSATPDGVLELAINTSTPPPLAAGTTVTLSVGVTDLVPINNAVVSAHIVGGANLSFANNGAPPDDTAGDHIYSASLPVPAAGSSFDVEFTVSAPGKQTRTMTSTFGIRVPPANDQFASRIALSGLPVSTTGNNVEASKEAGEPNHAGIPGGKSVWWSWTAPSSTAAVISTLGSSFDTVLAVYTGSSLSTLSLVAGNDDWDGLSSRVTFAAVAGTTYQIAVDGYGGSSGDIQLSLDRPPVPDNDAFAGRTIISTPSGSYTGDNFSASKEPGEPNHAGDTGGHSVWWSWTANGSGVTTIDTTGSAFDTLLAVYTGGAVNSLSLIAQNDDANGGLNSQVTFNAVAGTTYQIAVDGYAGSAGWIQLNLAGPTPPPNDDFVNAYIVRNPVMTLNGDNLNATKEPGEPNHAGDTGGRSVWWVWTARASGPATLDTIGSSFDTLLAVYTGGSVNSLTLVAQNDDSGGSLTSQVNFSAVAGTTYHFVVDGFAAHTGTIQLNLAGPVPPPPANDQFANRTPFGWATSVTGNNDGATEEPGEPNHAGNDGGRSVWWTWTSPAYASVTMSTAGSTFDTTLAVYTGTSVSGLSLIAANDDTIGLTSEVTFSASAGTTYQIAVDGYSGSSGNIQLRLSGDAVTPPANDQFADRILLQSELARTAGNNAYATKEAGEPSHAGDAGGHSVWWSWTAPSSESVIVTTVHSTFDTLLGVYTGNSVGSLTLIAQNDDAIGLSSVVMFQAVAGTTYQIAVDGYNGSIGEIYLTVGPSRLVRPVNDSFAHRLPIGRSDANIPAENYFATREVGEPEHAGGPGGKSLWWTWTARATGPVTVDTHGSDFDTLLAVYAGNAVDNLILISDDNDSPFDQTSQLIFNATAGITYHIAVDGYRGAVGMV
ncbi:MAG TPA: S8 family serine peptidase, partial [Candidatus Saccharimonadales bacterium]|nr:S8 family serine peptidase [Candidatus Saccharimonadales bacterium]